MASDSYSLAGVRYPLPAWAQLFVTRVDHSPAYWKRPATQGLTAAEALLLLDGLGDNRGDGIGRQEAQDGYAGHATKVDGQDGPHTGDDPDDGGAAVCGPDGTPPWRSWPLLSLPMGGTRSGGCWISVSDLVGLGAALWPFLALRMTALGPPHAGSITVAMGGAALVGIVADARAT